MTIPPFPRSLAKFEARTFDDRVHPDRTALLIVDVQNDFCTRGGYADREGRDLTMVEAMITNLLKLVVSAREFQVPIIFVRSIYGASGWYLSDAWMDRAYQNNPRGGHISYPVCEQGDWGARLVEPLRPESASDEIVLTKHRYSAFFDTELDLILRTRRLENVVISGVTSNVCVESTARDAFMRDYFVVVAEDCCAAYSPSEHDGAMKNVGRYFGEVATSDEIIDAWQRIHKLSKYSRRRLGAFES